MNIYFVYTLLLMPLIVHISLHCHVVASSGLHLHMIHYFTLQLTYAIARNYPLVGLNYVCNAFLE